MAHALIIHTLSLELSLRRNPFHNFEHASHVTMSGKLGLFSETDRIPFAFAKANLHPPLLFASVLKMLGRVVAPKELAPKKVKKGGVDPSTLEAKLHDHTFGITSDPLTQFACAFSGE
jgi:hypothetical protein